MNVREFGLRGLPPVALALAFLCVSTGRADFFSWEESADGMFTDPNRWHGPDFPDHTRFPGANDDASISRGPLTVTISGDQATRDLVVSQPTFRILGTYSVASLFVQGSPLSVTGGGTLRVTLWQLGAENIVEGAQGQVTTLQPLGSSPPSILAVRNGGQVTSQALDRSRGSLRVVVEGGGATWRHAASLPFSEVVVRANGRIEVPATEGIFLDAEGQGALVTVAGQFRGYGRLAGGARIESAGGLLADQPMTVDGGTWAVQETFINDGVDLTLRNGGVLTANRVQPGTFGSVTAVEGPGSRFSVADTLRSRAVYQLRNGGLLRTARAEIEAGGVLAEDGGSFAVTGDLFSNAGINVLSGGLLTASAAFLADAPNRGGAILLDGAGASAVIANALAVGQHGEGTLTVRNQGKMVSGTTGLGLFGGSIGRASLNGAQSEWTLRPAAGAALLVGDAGRGEISVSGGAGVQMSSPGLVIFGREPSGEGTLFARDFGSRTDFQSGTVIVGQRGRGMLDLAASAEFQANTLNLGQSSLDNRVTADGEDTLLAVLTEAVVGDGGRGSLTLQGGAQGIVKRLAVGRASVADNRVLIQGAGTRLTGSGRVDVGELHGRGRLDVLNSAQAHPAAGVSVGIYDGSDGTLVLDREGSLDTREDAIFGGGAASKAAVSIQGGGVLSALDVLLFARPGGTSTVEVIGPVSWLDAARDLQVGFGRQAAGPTLLRAGPGALVSAGSNLFVGRNGRFEVNGARVTVGVAETPPAGVVRVGPGGRLGGSGLVQGTIEVVAGGRVSPGSSPGVLTVKGSYSQAAGGVLEIELAGATPDSGHDVLRVTGAARLSGELILQFTEGFAPKAGQTFQIAQADGGLEGSFGTVTVTGLAPGFQYTLVPEGGNVLGLRADNDGITTTVPTLGITQEGAASVAVSWLANGTWNLQSAPTLGGSWSAVSEVPVRVGERWVVTLPSPPTAAFFRLR